MADRLKPAIMAHLEKKLGKTAAQRRPRISEIRRESSALTMNAAAQVYAEKQGTSVLAKLDPEDRQSLGIYQQAKNITNNIRYGKRVDNSVNVNAERIIGNMIAGHNNTSNQQQFGGLERALIDLAEKIDESVELEANEKNDLAAELGTILSQSKKSSPDKETIERSWSKLSVLSKLAGIAGSVATVGQLLYQAGLIK